MKRSLVLSVLPRPSRSTSRFARKSVQYLLDIGVLLATFFLAYALRFEFDVPRGVFRQAVTQLPFVVLVQFGVLSVAGVYGFIWRYIGVRELLVFGKAAVAATLPLVLLRIALPGSLQEFRVPLSVIFIDAGLGFGGVLSLRVLRRVFWESWEKDRNLPEAIERKRALLVGAGAAGVLALKEILGRRDSELDVRGFVDDDPQKHDFTIQGVRVVGATSGLPGLVRNLAIDEVVITIAQAPRASIRRIVQICESIPVKVRIMPGIWEILQGDVHVSSIRDVEIEDLLGRDPV